MVVLINVPGNVMDKLEALPMGSTLPLPVKYMVPEAIGFKSFVKVIHALVIPPVAGQNCTSTKLYPVGGPTTHPPRFTKLP
jgi:hypothetical protein